MAISLLRLKSDLKWYRYSLFAVMGMFPLAYLSPGTYCLCSLCRGVLNPSHCLVVCLLHAIFGVVGVPMAEPI